MNQDKSLEDIFSFTPDPSPMDNQNTNQRFKRRRVLLRIYLNGIVGFAIIWIAWRIIHLVSPWHSIINNPWLAGALSAASLLFFPLLFGALVEFGLYPLLGKWRTWSDIWNLQDRFISELSRENPKIVIIPWPDKTTRTLGFMTSEFPGNSSCQGSTAAVFVPIGPNIKNGYIRIVPVDEIELTDWSVKDLQLFQWTLGAVAPKQLNNMRIK